MKGPKIYQLPWSLKDVSVGVDEIMARVQWDTGANKALITKPFAKKCCLTPIPTVYQI